MRAARRTFWCKRIPTCPPPADRRTRGSLQAMIRLLILGVRSWSNEPRHLFEAAPAAKQNHWGPSAARPQSGAFIHENFCILHCIGHADDGLLRLRPTRGRADIRPTTRPDDRHDES